jgi:hypothetical protein
MLSGKVSYQYAESNYRLYDKGRNMYSFAGKTNLYKGEVLNYIRNKQLIYNENFSDKTGKLIDPQVAVDTLLITDNETSKEKKVPLYKEGKKYYIIEDYMDTRVYMKRKRGSDKL